MRVRLRSNSRSWRRLRTVRNVLGPLFVTLALCLPLLPGFVGSDPATVPASTKTTWAGNGTSTLSVSGRSPGAVGLSWTASADALFTNYELYESTTGSSGPWTDLGPIAGRNSTTYYEDGLGAGTMHWWKVAVVDGLLGSTDSNVVQATLPAVASITAGQSSSSTVTLAWTNGADYSGLVGFRAYQVYEILGNGSPQVVATISDVAQRTFAAGSLLNNSTYRFQVGTTDQCAGAANCGFTTSTSTTSSNNARVTTLATLRGSVTVHRSPIVQGSNGTFSCYATGGRHPYAFSWTFGDGATGSGVTAVHQYRSNGTFAVTCVVTDGFGAILRAPATVVVSPASGGSHGSNGSGNGTPGGSGGTPPTSSTPVGGSGHAATKSPYAILGPIGAVVLVVSFIAAVAWLALLARRRRNPPVPSGATGKPDPTPGGLPPPVPPPPEEAKPRAPLDLDRLMDELETASGDGR